MSKGAKIGTVVALGVVAVGTVAFFENRHNERVASAEDTDGDKAPPAVRGAPRWKRVGA
jgi:hypothetical protein